MKRTVTALALGTAVVIFMMGCTVDRNNQPDNNGGSEVRIQEVPVDSWDGDESSLGAIVSDGVIVYTAAGSSSCPDLVESVTAGTDTVTLHIVDYPPNTACTMDYVPVRQEISRTDGKDFSSDIEVVIDHPRQP